MNLPKLDEYCLLEIMQHLNPIDQIAFGCVCKEFTEIFRKHFKSQYKEFDTWTLKTMRVSEMEVFRSIGPLIEYIIIRNEAFNINLIFKYCPNIVNMEMWKKPPRLSRHNFIFSEFQLFKFSHLKHLHLYLDCIQEKYFSEICKNLSAVTCFHIDIAKGVTTKSLKMLARNSEKLEDVFIVLRCNSVQYNYLGDVKSLKNIKIVVSYTFTKKIRALLRRLAERRAEQLEVLTVIDHRFESYSEFQSKDWSLIAKMSNLKRVFLKFADFQSCIDYRDLLELVALRNLGQIVVNFARSNITQIHVLTLMHALRNLTTLSIVPMYVRYRRSFFPEALAILQNRIPRPTTPFFLGVHPLEREVYGPDVIYIKEIIVAHSGSVEQVYASNKRLFQCTRN